MAYVAETLSFKSGGTDYIYGFVDIWQDAEDPIGHPSYATLKDLWIYSPTQSKLQGSITFNAWIGEASFDIPELSWRTPLYNSSTGLYFTCPTNISDIPALTLGLLPGDQIYTTFWGTIYRGGAVNMRCTGTLYMPNLVTVTPPHTVMLNALNRFTCTPFVLQGQYASGNGMLSQSKHGCLLYADATTPLNASAIGRTITEFYWYPAYSLAEPEDFVQGIGSYYFLLGDNISVPWYSNSVGGQGGVSLRCVGFATGSKFEGTIVYNETPPSSCAPAVTLTATEVSGIGILAQYGRYVKGKSQVRFDAAVSYLYGAKETWFDLTVGFLYTQNKSVTFWPESGGSVLAHAEDDHNGETDLTGAYLVYDYWTPGLTQAIHRCKQDGTRDDAGSYCLIEWEINVAPLGDQNSRSLTITHPAGTSTPTLSSYTASGSLIVPADPERSYEISYTLTDDFETVTRTVQLSTAGVIMDIFRGGHGISFGKVAEKDHTFEISSELDTLLNTQDAKLINLVDALTALAQATGVDIYVHDNE